MNEIQLIRSQLAAERGHAQAVANACTAVMTHADARRPAAASLAPFQRACVDYLVRVLAWFEERDQRLGDLARTRTTDAACRALEAALASHGGSREALEKLARAAEGAPAGAPRAGWPEFAQFFNEVWSPRRDVLDDFLRANHHIADWRAVAGVDADSILEERERYARVVAAAPAGILERRSAARS